MPSETYLNTIQYLENETEPYVDLRLLAWQLELGLISLKEAQEIYLTYTEKNFSMVKTEIEKNLNNSEKLKSIARTIRRMYYRQALSEKQTLELLKTIQKKLTR